MNEEEVGNQISAEHELHDVVEEEDDSIGVAGMDSDDIRDRDNDGSSWYGNGIEDNNDINRLTSSMDQIELGKQASIRSSFSEATYNSLDDSSSEITFHRGWSNVEAHNTSSAPCQRSLHAACVLNDNMYIFGGYDGQRRLNDFYCFNFKDSNWSVVVVSSIGGAAPSPRDRHVALIYNNSFYVFGGFDGTSRVDDFFRFDFSSMSWWPVTSSVPNSAPSPRHSHSAVVYNNKMYVFGGYDGSYRSDFHEFDFATNHWSLVPNSGRPPRARYRATTVIHNHTLLLFGGHDGTRHLSDTHIFDFHTKLWSHVNTDSPPPVPRDSHVAVIYKDAMYIYGGSTGTAMNDFYQLTIPTPTNKLQQPKWSPVLPSSSHTMDTGHRFCHAAVVYNHSIYVFGGYDGSNRLNDFIKFDFGIHDYSCHVPPSTLLSDLKSFVNNETMSDVMIIVECKTIYAHKIMLMRCPYFRAMFTSPLRESSENTIHIEQVRHPIFLFLLEYLYTDHLTIPLPSAMELFVAADRFCIPRLKSMCENTLLSSLNAENAASIFHAADTHCATSLKKKTLRFILGNFESVSKTEAFEEMARENVELVFEILRNR